MHTDTPIFHLDNSEHRMVLQKVAQNIQFPLSAHIKNVVTRMKEKLLEINGVGLAAPQIGEDLSIISINITENQAKIREHAHEVPMAVLFNPRYEGLGEPITEDWEACFSVNNLMGKVPRYYRIRYFAHDENGATINTVAEGFLARVLQHEIDHVNGILIIDRLREDSIRGPMNDMMALRMAELSPEKKTIYDELQRQMNTNRR